MIRQNILITGASSGLGEEMSRAFASMGRNLALCARRIDRLESLKQELEARYPAIRISIRQLDVTDHDQVFEVFRSFAAELGRLDRIVVNAGLGKGASLGTGYFHANRQTAMTNFVGALAQCEAALEIFREQNQGHLVVISSLTAVRGMRGALTTYAATKAGISALAEGIRADLLGTPIVVSTMLPGYIRSEMTARVKRAPFMVDTAVGARALVRAIDAEKTAAFIPFWPWAPVGFLIRWLPLRVVARMF